MNNKTKSKTKCAIYTRKSTSQGLEQEFNSLDAQREAAEAYIASQKGNGWVCLPDQYNDGGFTGANMERPGLKMLLDDIEAGKIDCVVVYKVDRISRSLLDFSRLIEVFDRKEVSLVSITPHFDTSSSMGRLTKSWTTKKGKLREGKRFDKGKVHKILTNSIYLGKITSQDELYDGEHEAIIDKKKWSDVRKVLRRNGRKTNPKGINSHGALLKGLVYCATCKTAMPQTYTTGSGNGNGNKVYRYYVCSRAQKEGWNICPTKSISAQIIEKFVVDRIRLVGKDTRLLDQTCAEAVNQNTIQLQGINKRPGNNRKQFEKA